MVWRPDEAQPKTNTGNYLGLQKVAIIGFLDNHGTYDWDDVNLEVELAIEGSDYTKTFNIAGEIKKDSEGNLEFTPIIDKLYKLFDVIGFKGGINIKGEWVSDEDEPIDDIGAYLSAKYASTSTSPAYKHYAYIFKKTASEKSDKDYYTTVYSKLWPLDVNGKKQAESFVAFMRKGNKWKEFFGEESNRAAVQEIISNNPNAIPDL